MNNTAAQTPAARTQRFSAKSLSMGSLGTDQARYVIPVYQRPYAWTSVQVSQLMQDLLDFYRSPDIQSTYSLGTIVCDEETPGVFSILDGQQRLTTIDLLLEEISCRPAQNKGTALPVRSPNSSSVRDCGKIWRRRPFSGLWKRAFTIA